MNKQNKADEKTTLNKQNKPDEKTTLDKQNAFMTANELCSLNVLYEGESKYITLTKTFSLSKSASFKFEDNQFSYLVKYDNPNKLEW